MVGGPIGKAKTKRFGQSNHPDPTAPHNTNRPQNGRITSRRQRPPKSRDRERTRQRDFVSDEFLPQRAEIRSRFGGCTGEDAGDDWRGHKVGTGMCASLSNTEVFKACALTTAASCFSLLSTRAAGGGGVYQKTKHRQHQSRRWRGSPRRPCRPPALAR